MTLQDYMIKGSFDFMEGSFSLHVPSAKFGGHSHCGSGDMYLIYHMTLHDHVNKKSCDFIERRSSLHVAIQPRLMVIGIVIAEICFKFIM